MPAAQATLAPFSPVQQLQSAEAAEQTAADQEVATAKQGAADVAASEARTRADYDKFEGMAEGLHPPKPEFPAQPQVQQTSPLHQWASAAMVFAAIGSLFTRRPLTTAIGAASTALDAFRKNDIANATAAFNTWKTNMDYAFKLADYQNDQYKTALGDIRDREKMALDLGSREEQDRVATAQALAHAFGDEAIAAQTKAADMVRIIEARIQSQTATPPSRTGRDRNIVAGQQPRQAGSLSLKPPKTEL